MKTIKIINSDEKFQKKRIVDVNAELSVLIRRIELNYGISFEEARNSVNIALQNLSLKLCEIS